jgi:hypothetical protein
MVHVVEHLPTKVEALSSRPNATKNFYRLIFKFLNHSKYFICNKIMYNCIKFVLIRCAYQ